ncbi:hypothetical protein [Methanolacinia paynteri]|uniref:hypothetical protein n=1 Tax=Methanolacinia paynteri TaxID=230356 RepID=UPI00064FE6D7|nr:hypothetical protein [Methanolacinia paynteri]
MSESLWFTLYGLPSAVRESSIKAKETQKKLNSLKPLKKEYGGRDMTGRSIKTIRQYGQTAYGLNFGDLL